MKITKITNYVVHPGWRKNLIFVKVETDEGITGWGEAYSQYDRDRAVVDQLDALGPFVEFCDRISPNQLKPKNGYIELPTAPGLGVDVDEDALRKFPGKPYALRKLRHPASGRRGRRYLKTSRLAVASLKTGDVT